MDKTTGEKVQALAQYLKIKKNEIKPSDWDDCTFIIDERKQMRGTSPDEYKATAEALRSIMHKSEIKLIDEYLEAVELLNSAHIGSMTLVEHETKLKELLEFGKKAYTIASATIQKAQQRADEATARMAIMPGYMRKAGFTDTDKQALDKWMHWTNPLYFITDHITPENNATTQAMRKAWKGEAVEDTRELETVNAGEYLVLTDEEADKRWDEDLDNYIDDCILPEVHETARKYFDRETWKSDAREDGRGHSLNRYDGAEWSETVNGTEYYIYRTN